MRGSLFGHSIHGRTFPGKQSWRFKGTIISSAPPEARTPPSASSRLPVMSVYRVSGIYMALHWMILILRSGLSFSPPCALCSYQTHMSLLPKINARPRRRRGWAFRCRHTAVAPLYRNWVQMTRAGRSSSSCCPASHTLHWGVSREIPQRDITCL